MFFVLYEACLFIFSRKRGYFEGQEDTGKFELFKMHL
jgi:hypothetical protein